MTLSSSNPGMVYLVGAGPGDPGLITVRGLECLRQAAVVVYDRLANPLLLSYARENAELIDAGKEPEHRAVPQTDINALLLEHARAGKVVVRLKGGDPFVFGRGGEEAAALAEAGIPFEIVPGVSSAIAAPAYAGIPVTHRGLACSVAFATGHRASEAGDPACDWQRLADGPDTLVFLMGVHSLPRIAEELIAHGRSAETPVAVIAQASGPDQRTVTGPLREIAVLAKAEGIRPPAVIVVGEVVQLRETLRWFDLPDRRPLLGQTILIAGRRMSARVAAGEMRTNGGKNRIPPHPKELLSASPYYYTKLTSRLAGLGAEAEVLEVAEAAELADAGPLDLALHEVAAPPLGDGRVPRRALGGWLVFPTSESVIFTLNRFFRLGYDARALAGCKLHAANAEVAAVLLDYGLRADQLGPAHAGFRSGQRALWLGARLAHSGTDAAARPTAEDVDLLACLGPASTVIMPADLCRYGLLVREIPAFTLRPARSDRPKIASLRDGRYTALVITSSLDARFIEHGLCQAGGSLAALPPETVVICVDDEAAAEVRKSRARVDVVAAESGGDGIVEAIARHRQAGEQIPS